MKPKRRPLPRLSNRLTGTASRPPRFSRSATKLCSTRSASTGLPKPKDTTSCRQERKSSRHWVPYLWCWCPISRVLCEKACPEQSRRVGILTMVAETLRNLQRDVLALRVGSRSRRNGDGIDAGRGAAYWCL